MIDTTRPGNAPFTDLLEIGDAMTVTPHIHYQTDKSGTIAEFPA